MCTHTTNTFQFKQHVKVNFAFDDPFKIFTLEIRNSRIKLHVYIQTILSLFIFLPGVILKVTERALRNAQPQLFNATKLSIEKAYLK